MGRFGELLDLPQWADSLYHRLDRSYVEFGCCWIRQRIRHCKPVQWRKRPVWLSACWHFDHADMARNPAERVFGGLGLYNRQHSRNSDNAAC
jgi:uncharacterized protein YhjY with autotransporter beta-barrel domain